MGKKSVLFICLGNIYRSQIAHAVMQHLVDERGIADQWHIDSAAIGDWHIGKGAYDKTIKCLENHGIPCTHKARLICKKDFTTFDVIFGMDDQNMSDIEDRKPGNSTAKQEMLGSYDPQKVLIIEDPYFDDKYEDFETVFDQCERCCKAFLEKNS